MNETPNCPVCQGVDWQVVGKRTYALSDLPRLSDYNKRRYRVLFEVWLPGAQSVTLTSKVCENCGFITYAPRPTPAEVDAKYRFLGSLNQDAPALAPDAPIERRRARDLFRHATRHARAGTNLRVLDYGGGDGRLMCDFIAAGHTCFLIDYRPNPVASVTRLGTTEADLQPGEAFDLIICSHVIEHVAEPRNVIRALATHLGPAGMLYIEVPMEIWGRPPLHEEPVTHVNFFTPASSRRLMAECGLVTLSCHVGRYYSESGKAYLSIRTIARGAAGGDVALSEGGLQETLRLLQPDAIMKLKRYGWMPDLISDRLKRLAGR